MSCGNCGSEWCDGNRCEECFNDTACGESLCHDCRFQEMVDEAESVSDEQRKFEEDAEAKQRRHEWWEKLKRKVESKTTV